jgi:hypothetical protein
MIRRRLFKGFFKPLNGRVEIGHCSRGLVSVAVS